MNKVSIIGSGFSSLSAACYLAQAGYQVNVYEKNASLGGRARVMEREGFRFDMGPSWYWMPDIFEEFFKDFDRSVADFYTLNKLSPAYEVFFEDFESVEIGSSLDQITQTFERLEPGSGSQLKAFLRDAQYNYDVAMQDIVHKPGISPLELITPQTVGKMGQFFSSISSKIRKKFKHEKLIQILEFPVLFLGAKPENTPAFYNFMNYADLALGTWYPDGGMHKIVEGMVTLGKSLGVTYHTNAPVDCITTSGSRATGIVVDGKEISSDVVLSGADYQHTETLLPQKLRSYSAQYWESRTFAPSALLFYVGFDKKVEHLKHHNLFFDQDFNVHAHEIYDKPTWPSAPLFYASFPSLTDKSVAPEGKECGFFLIPLAPGLQDDKSKHDAYFEIILQRIKEQTQQDLSAHVLFKESYAIADFKQDYNAFKGNAYGMANTLKQTAFLRPKIKSKKVEHLFFTGQLSVPGPGVPPAIISGKIAAKQIQKSLKLTPNAASI